MIHIRRLNSSPILMKRRDEPFQSPIQSVKGGRQFVVSPSLLVIQYEGRGRLTSPRESARSMRADGMDDPLILKSLSSIRKAREYLGNGGDSDNPSDRRGMVDLVWPPRDKSALTSHPFQGAEGEWTPGGAFSSCFTPIRFLYPHWSVRKRNSMGK